MRILFITPYPLDKAPSQRFRFEQYIGHLRERGHRLTFAPFLDDNTWRVLYQNGKFLHKTIGIFKGFVKRVLLLFRLYRFDFVFIHREAAPVGPPVFEWFIAKVLQKKIIYDFDDAIWLPNTSAENRWAAKLKWHSKTGAICRWSYKISCGNDYLCAYARQFNQNVVLNPTTIDTDSVHNPDLYQALDKKELIIGWTGSHSTLVYLDQIVPIIQALEKRYRFAFMVIADKAPKINCKSLLFVPWNKRHEISDLMAIDIGIMPLTDDAWAKGKCGFKALQYMALGIPALVSPVGVNAKIVDEGVNGFICHSQQDWHDKIEMLLMNPVLRKSLGKKAREKIVKNYSVMSNVDNFLALFE